ncbi:conjugal transfer protein TraD [Fusobacterium nucleatum]|uniref:Conjugal transfer protein TraD n=1 Tax=Fusobacterium nucleatum TaxID=851 RepID=A0A133P5B5_FUSNU|nr:conjugal transfer protein TraD [Fusobacterium nucleatum]KXA23722.1 hypothetical protein HMPREF3221_00722 [Fusobacterium nucleatum]
MEQNYDEKIKEVKSNLNKLESKKNKTNFLTRKERAAHLIQKGALLEIAGIDNVDSEILLGYFLWFKDVPEEKLEKLKAMSLRRGKRRKINF